MEVLIKVVGIILLAIGMALIYAFPVMWLWNALMPEIFGLIEIGFWQALGLSILCKFLFDNSNSNSK